MKFRFTQEFTDLNIYENIEIPMEELEKYFYDEDREEESITEAARQWFDDHEHIMEPTNRDGVDVGLTTAALQETHDRETAEAIAEWQRIQAAGPTMTK